MLGKYKYCIILAAACVFLFGALKKSRADVEKYKGRSQTYERTISDMEQKIVETEIRLNDSVTLYQAEVKDLKYSEKNLKARYEGLLKASKLKAKDVESITEVTTVIVERDTVIAEVDTFGGLHAQLKDDFVKVDVEVMKDLRTIIDYEIKDSLTVINVQKKHRWLFGLIKWNSVESTRVINHNPKARITGLQTISIVE